MHSALADDFAALTYMNAKVIGIEVLLAIAATLGAGLYPSGVPRRLNLHCN